MAAPSNFNELIEQINAMLANFAEEVGTDVVSGNTVGVTDFSKAPGTYINDPHQPWTSSIIPLETANSVRGGICMIWYKGAVLSKSSFTGGVVTMFSGLNTLDELCRVAIDYDKDSDCFGVTIQTGFTGDLPPQKAPAQMTINNVVDQDLTAPAQMTINNIT